VVSEGAETHESWSLAQETPESAGRGGFQAKDHYERVSMSILRPGIGFTNRSQLVNYLCVTYNVKSIPIHSDRSKQYGFTYI
jgi:hypothetical protein